MRSHPILLAALLLAAAAGPSAALDLGYRGWSLRAGVADDPDQLLVGAAFDLGRFTPDLRVQPSFEIGFGDDATVVSGTLPVHYLFQIGDGLTPYAGGGLLLAWVDRDEEGRRGRGDGEDFEIAPIAVGGVEWLLKAGPTLSLELGISGGEAHDARLLAGVGF